MVTISRTAIRQALLAEFVTDIVPDVQINVTLNEAEQVVLLIITVPGGTVNGTVIEIAILESLSKTPSIA